MAGGSARSTHYSARKRAARLAYGGLAVRRHGSPRIRFPMGYERCGVAKRNRTLRTCLTGPMGLSGDGGVAGIGRGSRRVGDSPTVGAGARLLW